MTPDLDFRQTTNLCVDEARLRVCLQAICERVGFEVAVAINQAAVQALAEHERRAGRDTGGFIS